MRLAATDSRLRIIASAIRHRRATIMRVGRRGPRQGRWSRKALAARAMMAKPKYEQAIPFGYQFNPEIYLSDRPKDLISAVTARHGAPPYSRCRKQDNVKQGDVS